MRKCANISPYMRRPLVIYDFARRGELQREEEKEEEEAEEEREEEEDVDEQREDENPAHRPLKPSLPSQQGFICSSC